MSAKKRAPAHLSPEAARIWRSVVDDYELEARHELTLVVALEALDRLRQAQAEISRDGITIAGRFGPRQHPALAVERDARIAFLRASRELGLDLEAPATSRPPTRWRD
jgi:P27 family predicted phage terminase small subunit